MKYALIGCGRISINHLKAAFNNKLDIVACCDVNLSHIEDVLKKCSFSTECIKRYSDYKKMISENHIDIVAVATESGKHAEIALYCIKKGINVIIEKPIAMSIKDADLIVSESAKNNVKVCVCHQNRFNQAVIATKKAIDEGRLGKLSHASICIRWNRDENYYNQAPWRGTWSDDGGTLMNQCIHGIDLLLYLVGSPVKNVYGQTRQRFHDYLEAEDVGMGLLSFENGATGSVEGTVNVYPKNLEETLCLFGQTGTVKIGGTSTNRIDFWDFQDKRHDDLSICEINEATSNVYGNGHTLLYGDMIDAIRNNREPLVSAEEGRNALSIVLAIYKSQKTGGVVTLPLGCFSTLDMKGTFGK
jgi:UDP-N-acetyl-2-amino-2-deoxyglucuronate dehydrogenase